MDVNATTMAAGWSADQHHMNGSSRAICIADQQRLNG
jgi:hypothetical protein